MNKNSVKFTPLESRILLYLLDGRAPRWIMEKLLLNHNTLAVHLSHCRSKVKASYQNRANPEKPTPPQLPITEKQRVVLELRAAGKSHPEIANQIGISLCTSYLHASQGMRRLGVDCRNGFHLEPLQRALAKLQEVKND